MRVFSNTAISVDGRIASVEREFADVGSAEDKRRMSLIRAQADAVLVGGSTFRVGPVPMVENPEDKADRGGRPMINAVLTRAGILAAPDHAWPDERVELHVFAGEGIDIDAHAERFAATVHQHSEPDVDWVLDKLAELGCEQVLVEGGGDLIFQVIAAGRLDELYVTMAPCLIGGVGAPSLADGSGFPASQIQGLRLAELERIGDELFLRYEVCR